MGKIEKVKFTDGDANRTVFLRITRETDRFLRGVEVNKEADEVSGPGFDTRTRIIEKNLIVSRREQVVSLKYGWLVPVPKGK